MEYIVIHDHVISKVVDEVNSKIMLGYEPLGNITVITTIPTIQGKSAVIYDCYQAMIKR